MEKCAFHYCPPNYWPPSLKDVFKHLKEIGYIDDNLLPLTDIKTIAYEAEQFLAPKVIYPICGKDYLKDRKNKSVCGEKTCADKKYR